MKMEIKKNNNVNNGIINSNGVVDKSQTEDGLPKSTMDPTPNRNSEHFDFGIDQEFIKENEKNNDNLVRHGQNYKRKFAPFTRSQRRKRRIEVYKLHFEHGMPATRIAEMIKVDRNTINNDLKILYREALTDYSPEDMSLDENLREPSRIFLTVMSDLELMDYARRYFERKGDITSVKRAQELRKFYK